MWFKKGACGFCSLLYSSKVLLWIHRWNLATACFCPSPTLALDKAAQPSLHWVPKTTYVLLQKDLLIILSSHTFVVNCLNYKVIVKVISDNWSVVMKNTSITFIAPFKPIYKPKDTNCVGTALSLKTFLCEKLSLHQESNCWNLNIFHWQPHLKSNFIA